VSRAIVGYVKHFFSCRHCAENFAHKVQDMGDLPATAADAVIWLWKIHNKANVNLKGDPTEDPAHPKKVWPTTENCPLCRVAAAEAREKREAMEDVEVVIDGSTFEASGVVWNVEAVAEYLEKVYGAGNVVDNPKRTKNYVKGKNYLQNIIVYYNHFALLSFRNQTV
jgi:hypothetical protein